jgi:hypothetical protein
MTEASRHAAALPEHIQASMTAPDDRASRGQP